MVDTFLQMQPSNRSEPQYARSMLCWRLALVQLLPMLLVRLMLSRLVPLTLVPLETSVRVIAGIGKSLKGA